MKAFKSLSSMLNHGKNLGGESVKVLRKMPMWQRIVSAIVAFLLVFLLWPADAAKTITAWANDAETQLATEEVTDPDPESPDPGGGGEESDDPEVDPETPENPEVAGPILEDSSDEEATEEDGQIIFEGPNDYAEEACGRYEWDFSGFAGGVKLERTTNTPTSADYQASNKCAEIKFYQPYGKSYSYLDYDYAYVNSSGYTTNGSQNVDNSIHKLKDDGSRYNTHGTVFSNFILFTPNENILKLYISAASVRSDAEKWGEFANIGIVEFKGLDDSHKTLSKDFLDEVELRSASYSTIEFNNKGNGFKAGTKYAIYFRPNSCDYSDYNEYGGVKINNIKAEVTKGQFSMKISAPIDDTYKIKYMDSNNQVYETYFDAIGGEETEFISEEIAQGAVKGISITPTNHIFTEQYVDNLPIIKGDEVTPVGTINIKGYKTLKGKIVKNLEDPPTTLPKLTYKLKLGNDYTTEITSDSGETEKDFEIPCLWQNSYFSISVVNSFESTYKYKDFELFIAFDKFDSQLTEIDCGECEILGTLQDVKHTVKVTSIFNPDNDIKDNIKFKRSVDALQPPPSTLQSSRPSIWIDVEPYDIGENSVSYYAFYDDAVVVQTFPSNLWIHVEGEESAVNPSFKMPDEDLSFILEKPQYTWSGEGLNQECKGTFSIIVSDKVYPIEETVTAEDMKIDITKRPTATETGIATLTAEFKQKTAFSTQIKENVVIQKESIHIHDGITYDTVLTVDSSGKLPTATGNYYLDHDVEVSDMATISKGRTINICLNGYALYWKKTSLLDDLTGENASTTKTFYNNQGTLNICDCHQNDSVCRHYFNIESDGSWAWTNSQTSNYVDGGIITGAAKSAIFNEATLTCKNVNFIGNRNDYKDSNYGSGAGGGAIRSGTTSTSYTPDLQLESCVFKGNVSQGAGGSVLIGVSNSNGNGGTATISNTYFSDNALIGKSYSTGYNNPWGGGALATFAQSKNPTITIKGCEFYNNKSNYRGGAILLYHGTTCYMSDTIVQHNESGVYQDGSYKDFNYGGGINLYTGYGGTNYNQAFLYLSGTITCTENQSWTKENSVKVAYEDNLALQLQDNTKGYIYLQADEKLEPESLIGVNYATNTNIDISKGYGTSMLDLSTGSSDLTEPEVKCFVLDEVVGRLNYELLINTKIGDKAGSGTYELWIVAHQHNIIYDTYKSDVDHDNTQVDTLSVKCGTDPNSSKVYINKNYYYFSKCKYGHNSLPAKIKSIDGGESWSPYQIYYDGNEHGVEIENFYELSNHLFAQMVGPIKYYKVDHNQSSSLSEENKVVPDELLPGAPVEPGEYYGIAQFYDVQISGGKVVVNKDKKYTITSNHYFILGTQLTLEVQTLNKNYDGNNYKNVQASGYFRILDGLVESDINQVGIEIDQDMRVYCDPNNYFVGLHPITAWDTDKIRLWGPQSEKYSIGNIVGYMNIEPVKQEPSNSRFQITAQDEEDTPSIDLYSILLGDYYKDPEDATLSTMTFADTSTDLPYAPIGSIDNHTFTAKKIGEVPESRIKNYKDELDFTTDIRASKFEIEVTKVDGIDLGPDGETPPIDEYTEWPPPHTIYSKVYITGYIIYEGSKTVSVNLKTNENNIGHYEDDAGNPIENISLLYGGTNPLMFYATSSPWGVLYFQDVTGLKRINFVIDNSDYQLKHFINSEKPGEEITPNNIGPVFLFSSEWDLTAYFWLIPNPSLHIDVTPQNPPEQIKVGDVIDFEVKLTNNGNCTIYSENRLSDNIKISYSSGYGYFDDESYEFGHKSLGPDGKSITKIISYTVDSSDIAYGRLYADVFTQAYYDSDPYNDDTKTVISNTAKVDLPVEEMVKNIEIEITATPETNPMTIGKKITYYYKATNKSNVIVYSPKLSSELLGQTGYNAIEYNNQLNIGESGDVVGPFEYTVSAEDVERGYVVNTVECSGYVQRTKTSSELITGSAQASTKIEYSTVEYPEGLTLEYTAFSQQGASYNADAMTPDMYLWQTDVGVYYCTFTLKPLYKWSEESDKSTTHTVRFEITKKDVTVDSFTPPDPFEYNEKIPTVVIDTSKFQGFLGNDGIESATAKPNNYAVGTYYKSTPEKADSISIDLKLKANTNLNNYNIVYESSYITIKGYDINGNDIITDAQTLTYNEKEQTTRVTVQDKRFVREDVFRTLTAGVDYEILEGQTQTNASDDYKVKIRGIGNYSGEIEIPWKILKANLKLKIVANSKSTEFNGQDQTVSGYTIIPVSNLQDLDYTSKVQPAQSEVSKTELNVGTYPVLDQTTIDKFEYTDGDNVNSDFVFENGYLTITPVDITDNARITVTPKTDLVYNGEEQTNNFVVKYTPEGGEAITLNLGTDYDVTGNKGTNAKVNYNGAIAAKGNYVGNISNIVWGIAKCPVTVTHDAFEETYKGDVYVEDITINPFGEGAGKDSFVARLTTSSSNAKTYQITDEVNKLFVEYIPIGGTLLSNFDITQNNIQVVINKKSIVVSPTTQEFNYDGKEHHLSEFDVAYNKEDLCPGHMLDFDNGAITWANNSATEANGSGIEVSITDVKITNANAQTAETIDVTENYDINHSATAYLIIKKADLYLDIVGNINGTEEFPIYYTGKKQTAEGYKVSVDYSKTSSSLKNIFNDSKISPSPKDCIAYGITSGTHTMIIKDGDQELSFTDINNWNYDDDNLNVHFNLTPGYVEIQSKVITIRVNDSKYFDPDETSPEKFVHWVNVDTNSPVCEVIGLENDEELNSVKLETVDSKEGVYDELDKDFISTIDWGEVDQLNYIVEYDVVLTINQLQIITITGHTSNNSYKKYYTGFEQEESGIEVSSSKPDFFHPENVHVKPECEYKLTVKGTNAGKYWMGLKPSDFYYDYGTDPYEIKVVDGYLEILPKELEDEMLIKADPERLVYNGQRQGPTFVLRNGDANTGTYLTDRDYSIENGTAIDVGSYTAYINGRGNYTGHIHPVYWYIDPATVTFTIIGNHDERTYNGQDQTVSGYTYTVDKLRPYINEANLIIDEGKDTVTANYAGKYFMRLDESSFEYDDKNINPIFNVTNGFIKINPKNVSELNISLNDDEFTYDGSSWQPEVIIYDGPTKLDNDLFVIDGETSAIAAGYYSIGVTPSNSEGNYVGSATLPWKINKAFIEIDIKGNSAEFNYDATEKQVTGFNSVLDSATTLKNFHEGNVQLLNAQKAKASGVNANLYYMGLQASDFYYNDSSVNAKFNIVNDGCLTIKSIPITEASINASPLKLTYNFTEQGPKVEAKYKNDTLDEGKDFYLANSKATNVGDYKLNVIGVGNFTDSWEVDWQIVKLNYDVKISGKQESKPYTGFVQSVSGYTVDNPNEHITIYPLPTNTIASGTEVGNYSMNLNETHFSIQDTANINFSYEVVQDGLLSIIGTPLTDDDLTIIAEDRTYNGKEQYTKITIKDKDGFIYTEGEDFEIAEGASATDAGEITAKIVGLGNLSGEKTINWNMKKAEVNATVVGNNATYSYDESEHSLSGYVVYADSPLFNQGKVDCTQEPAEVKQTNVGSQTLVIDSSKFRYGTGSDTSFVADPNVNVEFSGVNGTLTIVPAEVVVYCHSTGTYVNNDEKYAPGQDLIKISGTERLTASLITNSGIPKTYNVLSDSPDGYSAQLTWQAGYDETNYNVNYDVELTIKEKIDEIPIVYIYGNKSDVTYSGSEQNVSGVTSVRPADIPEDEIVLKDTSTAYVAATKAGTYYMGLTAEDFKYTGETYDNVEFVVYDGCLQINPREIKREMIEVSPTQFTYNGKEQGPVVTVEYTDGFFLNLEDFDVVNGSAIDAGDYELQVQGKGNYVGTVGGFMWKIAKADLTLTVNKSIEYSGNIFNYEIQESDMKGNQVRDGIGGTITTNNSALGIYTPNDKTLKANVNYTGDGLNNYNLINNVVINITKRHLTVTPKSPAESFVYNGLEQKLLDKDVSYDNLAPNNTVEILEWTNNDGIVNVGKQDNIAVSKIKILDGAKNDVTLYYTIDYETASIEIIPNTIKIQIQGNKATYAYDGLAHSVEGYTAWEIPTEGQESITGLFDTSKLVCNKECKVSAVDYQDKPYMMGISFNDFVYSDPNVEVEAIEYKDGSLTITRNTLDAAVITTRDFVFDAKEHTTDVVVSINNQVLIPNVDYRIDPGCDLTATNVGTYIVGIEGLGKYIGESKEGTWKITKANMTIALFGKSTIKEYTGEEQVFPETVSVETLCNAIETSATGLFKAEKVALEQDYEPQAKGTELGTYTVGLDVGRFVYNDENVNAQFVLNADAYMEISRADISKFTASATDTVYNATEQTTSVTVKNGDEELVYGTDFVLEGQLSATNVGTYFAKVTGINNYKGTILDIAWNITKASLTITILPNEKTFVYNGYSQSVSGYSATPTDGAKSLFVAGDVLLVEGKQAILTESEVGDHTKTLESSFFAYDNPNIQATFVGESGATGEIAVNKLHITPKTVTIHAIDIKSEDAQKSILEHRISSADVDGTVAGQVLSGTVSTISGNAGEYTGNMLKLDNLKIDGKPTDNNADDPTKNYEIVNDSKLTITGSEDSSIYVTGITKTVEYNGELQSIAATDKDAYIVTTNMTDFDMSKLYIIGNFNLTGQNAGVTESNVSATYDGDANVVVTQSKLIIEKRSLTKAILTYNQETFTYNMQDQYPSDTSFSLDDLGRTLGNGDFEYVTPEEGSSIIPGHYNLELNADNISNSNYKDSVYLTYEIVKASRVVNVKGNSVSVTYNGFETRTYGQEITEVLNEGEAAVIDISSVKYATAWPVASGIEAGYYPMNLDVTKLTYAGTNKDCVDVNFSVTDGGLTIYQADITNYIANLDQTDFIYNAKAQGPKVISVVTTDGKTISPEAYDITGNSKVNANTFAQDHYTLTITGKGNFTGSISVPWTIARADRNVKIYGNDAELTYTGNTLSVVGWTADEETSEGEEKVVNTSLISPDYASCVASGKDVGTYNMNLDNSNFAYADSNNVNVTFDIYDGELIINKCDISQITFSAYPQQIIYNGSYQGPNILLKNGDNELKENIDYTIGGDKKAVYVKRNEAGDIQNYTLTIDSNNSKNYFGTLTYDWSIAPLPVDIYIKGHTATNEFNATEQSVRGIDFETTLDESLQSLIKLDNINYAQGSQALVTKGMDVGTYTKELNFNDFSYTDSNITASFYIKNNIVLNIIPRNIANTDAEGLHYPFTGYEIEADPVIKDNDYTLVAGVDYIAYDNVQTNVGVYTMYVEGINNYFGQKYNISWWIDKVELEATVNGNIATYKYDGNVHSVMGYTLDVEGKSDYNEFVNSLLVTPGVSSFIISSKGKFEGETIEQQIKVEQFETIDTQNYKVTFKQGQNLKLVITNGDATDINNAQVHYTKEFEYDGSEKSNNISVVIDETTTLTEGIDYDIVGITKATDVPGMDLYSFTIVGKGAYYGQKGPYLWNITPRVINYNAGTIQQTFTGDQIKALVKLDNKAGLVGDQTVYLNLASMVKKDSSDEIGKNVGVYPYPAVDDNDNYSIGEFEPGSNTLLNNYDLSNVVATLEITKKPLSDSDVVVSGENPVYNGTYQFIDGFDVAYGDIQLVKDIDFDLSGDVSKKDWSESGYSVTITAKEDSNYSGFVSKSWNIEKYKLESISIYDSKVFDGLAFTLDDYEVSTGVSNDRIMASWCSSGYNVGTYEYPTTVTQSEEWSDISGPGQGIIKNYDLSSLDTSVVLVITQKPIDPDSSDFEIQINSPIYNGALQGPKVNIVDNTIGEGGQELVENYDFKVTLTEEKQVHVPVGSVYHLTISKGLDSSNYSCESFERTWTIYPQQLDPFVYNPEASYYDGNVKEDNKDLTNSDIDKIISGDTIHLNAKTTSANVGTYKYDGTDRSNLDFEWSVSGKTDQKTDYDVNFTAQKQIISPDTTNIYVDYVHELSYNGFAQRPDVKVYLEEGGVEIDPSEYEIVGDYYKDVKDAYYPYYEFSVVDKEGGNYSFVTKYCEWKINPVSLSGISINDSKVYDRDESGYSATNSWTYVDGLMNNDKINFVWTALENERPAVSVGDYKYDGSDKKITVTPVPGNANTALINYTYAYDTSSQLSITKRDATFNRIDGTKNVKEGEPFVKSFEINSKTASGICEGDQFSAEFTTYSDATTPSATVGEYIYGDPETGNHLYKTPQTEGSVESNYNMTYVGKLTIKARSIDPQQNSDISYTVTNPKYNGLVDRLPEIHIYDGGDEITTTNYKVVEVIDEDQELQAQKNVKASYEPKYKALIVGQNIYDGSFVLSWNVDPLAVNISGLSDSKDYDTTPYEKGGIVIDSSKGLKENDQLFAKIVTYKDTTKNGDVGVYPFKENNNANLNSAKVTLTDMDEGQTSRNYIISLDGQIKINPRGFNPENIDVVYDGEANNPTYDAEYHQPDKVVVTDKGTGASALTGLTLVLGKDFEFVSAAKKDVNDAEDYVATIKGIGNYSGEGLGINFNWNIVPRDFELVVEAENPYSGEVFKYSGTETTGYGEDEFMFKYVTNSAEIGTYIYDPAEEEDPEVVEELFEPVGDTLDTNYNIVKNVTLKIVEAPVPPQPEPDVPEYVPGQTGDSTPVVGFAIMALTLIGAFLFLRRPKKVQGLHIR